MSQILIETLGSLKMSYPKVSDERRKELAAIRKVLAK
jgi:hypothetical protein